MNICDMHDCWRLFVAKTEHSRGRTVTLTSASPYFPSAETATLNVYKPATSWKYITGVRCVRGRQISTETHLMGVSSAFVKYVHCVCLCCSKAETYIGNKHHKQGPDACDNLICETDSSNCYCWALSAVASTIHTVQTLWCFILLPKLSFVRDSLNFFQHENHVTAASGMSHVFGWILPRKEKKQDTFWSVSVNCKSFFSKRALLQTVSVKIPVRAWRWPHFCRSCFRPVLRCRTGASPASTRTCTHLHVVKDQIIWMRQVKAIYKAPQAANCTRTSSLMATSPLCVEKE